MWQRTSHNTPNIWKKIDDLWKPVAGAANFFFFWNRYLMFHHHTSAYLLNLFKSIFYRWPTDSVIAIHAGYAHAERSIMTINKVNADFFFENGHMIEIFQGHRANSRPKTKTHMMHNCIRVFVVLMLLFALHIMHNSVLSSNKAEITLQVFGAN